MRDRKNIESTVMAASPAMRQLVDMTRRVALADSAVLITGESGSGKERIARLLHAESKRAAKPLIAVTCRANAQTLVEIEAANGGTLFLDEVGEVSLEMQVELLRVMHGSAGVRILAATHRDLAHEVAAGVFRQDLYYRLKVVELHVPPLRERKEDLLPLAQVLLAEAAHRLDRTLDGFGPRVADQLRRYDWPGNVRELQNAMEHCAVLARGSRVEFDDLPAEIRHVASPVASEAGSVRPLREIEKEYILAALASNRGNQTRTAEQLQIGVATLYRKLKSYRSAGAAGLDKRR
jgi:DNA-binding NtrC family response regulator